MGKLGEEMQQTIKAVTNQDGYAPGDTVTLNVTYWPDTINITATASSPGWSPNSVTDSVGFLDSFTTLVVSDSLGLAWSLVSDDGAGNAVYSATLPGSVTYTPEIESVTFDKTTYNVGDTAVMDIHYAALKVTVTVLGTVSRPNVPSYTATTVFSVGHNQLALSFTSPLTWTLTSDDGYSHAIYHATVA